MEAIKITISINVTPRQKQILIQQLILDQVFAMTRIGGMTHEEMDALNILHKLLQASGQQEVVNIIVSESQKKILEKQIRNDMIFVDPKADIMNPEKLDALNILHVAFAGIGCIKCEPQYFNTAVEFHIAKLENSNIPGKDEVIKKLKELLK